MATRMAEYRGPVENALQNPLILQTIFRNLNSSDLIECRLVNNLNWFDLATEILCEKQQIKIDFNFSDNLSSGKFSQAFENPIENPWSLKSLVNCIKHSRSRFFPCFRFRFSQADFDDEDLLEFFSIHGDSIIELEVDLIDRTRSSNVVKKFGELLWEQLPNLEKLTIWKVSLGWGSSARLFTKQVRETAKLPKLKYFSFEQSVEKGRFKFIEDIQNAAPNLQQVEEISFVPPKIQVGSNLMSDCEGFLSLSFSPDTSNIRFYERLVRIKAKFNSIRIHLRGVEKTWEVQFLSRVTGILNELLKSSQSTLREFDGVTEISSLPEIQLNSFSFPHVSSLESSNLKTPAKTQSSPEEKKEDKEKYKNSESSSISNLDLNSKWKISQTFPSLSQVCLSSLDFLQNFQESIQTVKVLKTYAEFSSPGDFEKLGKIFPNVEDLDLSKIKNFQECADSLWKNFGKVKKLDIRIFIENPEHVSMDDAFLGTRASSIFELRGLKTLRVTFVPTPPRTENGKGKWTHWNFLGKSTLVHIRQKMKQLKSITLVVEASGTDCKDKKEIHQQLEGFKPFAIIDVIIGKVKRQTGVSM